VGPCDLPQAGGKGFYCLGPVWILSLIGFLVGVFNGVHNGRNTSIWAKPINWTNYYLGEISEIVFYFIATIRGGLVCGGLEEWCMGVGVCWNKMCLTMNLKEF
jgi:hypothetical protein